MGELGVLQADALARRLAARLVDLRTAQGWTLEEAARRCGVSRSTLSRLERGELSPTAAQLGALCTAHATTMSRLLAEVEARPRPLIRAREQEVWRDDASGFTRTSVSPPHPDLRAEVVHGVLDPGADIAYREPPLPGLEQHIWMLEGVLDVTEEGTSHALHSGDCLRFRVWGPVRLRCPGPAPARYALVAVP